MSETNSVPDVSELVEKIIPVLNSVLKSSGISFSDDKSAGCDMSSYSDYFLVPLGDCLERRVSEERIIACVLGCYTELLLNHAKGRAFMSGREVTQIREGLHPIFESYAI